MTSSIPLRLGYLVIALVPVTVTARGMPVPGLRLSEALVVVSAAVILFAFRDRLFRDWTLVDSLFAGYAGITLILGLGNLIFRDQTLTRDLVAPLFLPLQFFLIFRCIKLVIDSEVKKQFAVRLLLFSSLPIAVLAAFQQLGWFGVPKLVDWLTQAPVLNTDGYHGFSRATATFQHWHPLAGYETVIGLLAAALIINQDFRAASKRLCVAALVGAVLTVMFSVTFIAMIGLVAGIVLLGYRARKLMQVLIWTTICGLVTMLMFSSYISTRVHNQYVYPSGVERDSAVPETIDKRMTVWTDEYLPALLDNWLTGLGPKLPDSIKWPHSESVYLTLISQGGVLLLSVFLALIWSLNSQAKKAGKADIEGLSSALVGLRTMILVLLGMCLLFPYFTASGVPQVFWALVGILLSRNKEVSPIESSSRENVLINGERI